MRTWDYSDYTAALSELGETPMVDTVVYAAFCPRETPKLFDLTTAAGKAALMQELETWNHE